MSIDVPLEAIGVCEAINQAIAEVRTYKSNFEEKMRVLSSPVIRSIVDNLSFVEAVLLRAASRLCTASASPSSAMAAFNIVDSAYPRIMGEAALPSSVKASVYEIHRMLRSMAMG